MDAIEAILTRRSVPKVTEDPPSKEQIESLLEAAVRAPCHHLTEPWRFVVVMGESRRALGDAWAAGAAASGGDPEKVEGKTLRAPVIVCVIGAPRLNNPKVVEIEEHHSVGALMQNILLAAHASGLGAMLRTGPAANMPEVREHLGVGEGECIAGFIYIGFPAPGQEDRPMTRRAPIEEKTEWRT